MEESFTDVIDLFCFQGCNTCCYDWAFVCLFAVARKIPWVHLSYYVCLRYNDVLKTVFRVTGVCKPALLLWEDNMLHCRESNWLWSHISGDSPGLCSTDPSALCVCVCVGGGVYVWLWLCMYSTCAQIPQNDHKTTGRAQPLGISVIQTERCGPLRAVLIKKTKRTWPIYYITLWIYQLPPQNVYSSLLDIHLQLVWLARPDALSKTNHSSVWSSLVWMNSASNKETIVWKQVSIPVSSEHFTNTQN